MMATGVQNSLAMVLCSSTNLLIDRSSFAHRGRCSFTRHKARHMLQLPFDVLFDHQGCFDFCRPPHGRAV